MAFNLKLLMLSRNIIEPYVINTIKTEGRNVKDVHLSTPTEDMRLKIDGFVILNNDSTYPIQVKTRTRDSENFSLSPKDIRDDQENRMFCFIDKTFDNNTVTNLLAINENANNLLAEEHPLLLFITQTSLKNKINDSTSGIKFNKTADGGYYLIPKSILQKMKGSK